MSADNWAYCPGCQANEAEEESGYMRPEFREDYEIYGAETGVVTVSYSGVCRQCGLSLHFEDRKPIPVGGHR